MNERRINNVGSADNVTGICSEERPELCRDKRIPHLDNAIVYYELRVREFLAKKSIRKMNHQPYSSNLAPMRILAFSKIKKYPEGTEIC
jgi:hypothetical protein